VFYNLWGGKQTRPQQFRQHLAADLTEVVALLADGAITPQVAARYPLADVSDAVSLAESRTVRGKVVLGP